MFLQQSVVVDSWETVKKQICSEKDFAPFSSLNYFDCGESFDNIPAQPVDNFIPLANDRETTIFPSSYAGSSYTDLFKHVSVDLLSFFETYSQISFNSVPT